MRRLDPVFAGLRTAAALRVQLRNERDRARRCCPGPHRLGRCRAGSAGRRAGPDAVLERGCAARFKIPSTFIQGRRRKMGSPLHAD